MIQKTIRFYPDNPRDVEALNVIGECRRYGFHSSREMIIAAINAYAKSRDRPGVLTEEEIDTLAQAITSRMSKSLVITANKETDLREEKDHEENKQYENYIKALDFIESL